MSVEANKALVRRFIEEVLNQGKFELMPEFYASSKLAMHIQSDGPALRQGFPDVQWVIEDLFAEGDKVATRWTMTGTNSGPFMGRPATGKTARWGGVTIVVLKDGKFVEEWVYPDRLAILQQIGMLPASMPAHASQQG